jgi:hypothetical protein
VHDHSVWLDGVYVRPDKDAAPVFVPAEPPTREQIERVATRVRDRFVSWLRRTKRIDPRPVEERSNEASEPDALCALLFAGSQKGTLSAVTAPPETPEAHDPSAETRLDTQLRARRSRWAANVDGFSVHAGTTVDARSRIGLEQLLRYCARPAVSLERLTRLPDGRFAYRVKHPLRNKTHRVMDPMELMARLASIVAPPRYPLVRYFGWFAPGCKARRRIVPGRAANPKRCCAEHERTVTEAPAPHDDAPETKTVTKTETETQTKTETRPLSPLDAVPRLTSSDGGTRIPWAELLRHGLGVDALRCPKCSATMTVVAVVKEPDECRRYMEHAGIATRGEIPTRAWDPVPIDPAFDSTPPDDAVA